MSKKLMNILSSLSSREVTLSLSSIPLTRLFMKALISWLVSYMSPLTSMALKSSWGSMDLLFSCSYTLINTCYSIVRIPSFEVKDEGSSIPIEYAVKVFLTSTRVMLPELSSSNKNAILVASGLVAIKPRSNIVSMNLSKGTPPC